MWYLLLVLLFAMVDGVRRFGSAAGGRFLIRSWTTGLGTPSNPTGRPVRPPTAALNDSSVSDFSSQHSLKNTEYEAAANTKTGNSSNTNRLTISNNQVQVHALISFKI